MKRYQYGNVIATDAVVEPVEAATGELKEFSVKKTEGAIVFTYEMDKETAVYGLGEQVRGINKRGWKYVSDCADDPVHSEEKHSLYASHNFLVVDGKERFGVFFDTPAKVVFDIGYTKSNVMEITTDTDVDVYIVEGSSLLEIVKKFRHAIGKSFIAPIWAFGYQQSRWGYMNESDIRTVVDRYDEIDIPLDTVYLDIDYMERFKDFTVDKERFPDLKGLSDELKKDNIRLIPIIDAGVKIEDGYDIYEEGVEKGYFCKEADGENFVGAVWPGKVHFPDFCNKEAREWFGHKYKVLTDMGMEGFWNDMNEPAIFYSEKGLNEALDFFQTIEDRNLGVYDFFKLGDVLNGVKNSPKDYSSFYHNIDGKQICHDKVHNIYGYMMTRAAGEAFEDLRPEKRTLMFSRASYIGAHRYGGVWMGDNMSWWSHILLHLKMMPSLNMCGFMYMGADMGGFGTHCTEDLMLRWVALGIFTPLMRNHSALGTREQEFYQFENIAAFRNMTKFRYRLIPYLYSEYMKAVLNDEMMYIPFAFAYPDDKQAKHIEDQLLVGDSLMIAPVYEQNATGRTVYLPEEMILVRLTKDGELLTKVLDKGYHYVEVDIEEVVFYIRKGKVLPLCETAKRVAELDFENLAFIGYTEGGSYQYYMDDGVSKDYDLNKYVTKIMV